MLHCAPQGDAFTLAFHSVADALLFSAAAQVELMLADWPEELLELEVCECGTLSLKTTAANVLV